FVLAQSGISRAQPVETFGRAQPLDVDEFEQVLKMVVPCRLIGTEKGFDRIRPAVVDRAEQFALDLVVGQRSEEGRVEVSLEEATLRRRAELRFTDDFAAVLKTATFRCHVEI